MKSRYKKTDDKFNFKTFTIQVLTCFNSSKATFAIFLLASLLRFALLFLDLLPSVDPLYYYQGAQSIAEGKGYLFDNKPTAFWPIGWPLMMAGIINIFGNNIFVLRLFTILLSLLNLYLIYTILKTITKRNRKFINLTLLLLSVNITDIVYSNLLWSETAQTSFLLIIILFNLKWLKNAYLSAFQLFLYGLTLGIASLVRLTFLPIPILLISTSAILQFLQKFNEPFQFPRIEFLSHIKLKHYTYSLAIIYFTALLIILPYTYRNYQLFNKFILVSDNGEINLFIGNNQYATGTYDANGMSRIKPDDRKNEITRFWREQPIDATILAFKKIAITVIMPRRSDGALYWLSLLPQVLIDTDYQELLQKLNNHEKGTLITHYDQLGSTWVRNKFYGSDKERAALEQAILEANVLHQTPITPFRLLIFSSEQLWYYSILTLLLASFFINKTPALQAYLATMTVVNLYYMLIWAVFFGGERFAIPLLPIWTILAAYSLNHFIIQIGSKTEELTVGNRGKGEQKQQS